MGILILLLTISTPAGDDPTAIQVTVPNLYTAMELAPLSKGLPQALQAPQDGYWFGQDGAKIDRGTFLPAPLDKAIMRRLKFLDNTPQLFQTQLDGLRTVVQTEADERVKVTEQRCMAEQLRAPPVVEDGWSLFEVAIIGVLTFAAGVGTYAIVDAVSDR